MLESKRFAEDDLDDIRNRQKAYLPSVDLEDFTFDESFFVNYSPEERLRFYLSEGKDKFDEWLPAFKRDFHNLIQEYKKQKAMSISVPLTTTQVATPVVMTQTPAKRRYRRRSYSRKRRYPRYLRAYRRLRREYPTSKYGMRFIPRSDTTRQMYGLSYSSATDAQKLARERDTFYGKGAYGIRRTLGSALKRFKLGQRLGGAALGGILGGVEGAAMGFVGNGEYSSNDLINMRNDMDEIPQFSMTDDEGIILSRKEYIRDVYGGPNIGTVASPKADPFLVYEFPINPGMENTFPWLSQIACNFEEYELLQCIFTYRATVTESANTANGQVGNILINTIYQAAAPNFNNKVEMAAYGHPGGGKISENCYHGVECDREKLSGTVGEFIRTGPVTGQDIKSFDHAKLNVAVANLDKAYIDTCLGELWVTYTVRLRKPKLYSAIGKSIQQDIYLSGGGTETNLAIFGTDSALLSGAGNNIGTQLRVTLNQAVLTFPNHCHGNYKISIYLGAPNTGSYTSALDFIADYQVSGNIKKVKDMFWDNSPQDWPASEEAVMNTYGGYAEFHVQITPSIGSSQSTVTFNFVLNGQNPSQTCMVISEYSPNGTYRSMGLTSSISSDFVDSPVMVNRNGTIVPVF